MQVRALPPDRVAAVGELLDPTPYALVGSLGRGGMAEVFVVEHEHLGRRFALKLIHEPLARQPGFTRRFQLEARALARVQHLHVVSVTDFWLAPGDVPCLVMELLQGNNLAQELRLRRRLPVDQALRIACQALEGLAAVHSAGLVHRDIKPANVFLHRFDRLEAPLVKLLDFGLARVLFTASPAGLSNGMNTTTGRLVGSPRYLSPEGLRGERVDHRADLYGVGLILFEMLTGEGPEDESSPLSTQLGASFPRPLDGILRKALDPDPARRHPSAEAFLADLQSLRRTVKDDP